MEVHYIREFYYYLVLGQSQGVQATEMVCITRACTETRLQYLVFMLFMGEWWGLLSLKQRTPKCNTCLIGEKANDIIHGKSWLLSAQVTPLHNNTFFLSTFRAKDSWPKGKGALTANSTYSKKLTFYKTPAQLQFRIH